MNKNFRLFGSIFNETGRRFIMNHKTFLLTPGHLFKKLQKSLTFKIDVLVLDCEDGVPPSKKEEARQNIKNILNKENFISDAELCVRVNSIASGIFGTDIKELLTSNRLPQSIILSKVETEEDIRMFSEELWNNLLQKTKEPSKINLTLAIETARGLINLEKLCEKAEELSTMAPFQPVALLLGGNHLIADLGCRRTKYRMELLYARQKLVAVAKAFKLGAIDTASSNYQDLRSFGEEVEEAAAMGFTGKLLVHPTQIAVAEENFSPTKSDIEWAKGLIEAYDKETGIYTYKGQIVDMGMVKQAHEIINRSINS